jgi:PAS domain S-box-containing protein
MISFDKSIEDEFRKLSRHLPDLIFQFTKRIDGTYHVPVASSGIFNVFGCTPEDVKDSFNALAKVIHPEDQQMVFDETERSAEQMADSICEARICSPGKPIQLSQAVEQSSTSIEITDLNGKIEYVNPQFLKSTGFSYDEVIGANPNILKSGYTKKETYKAMWQAIKSGTNWHGEFLNKKKNGHLFWEEVIITPIKNEDGEIINFLGIKNDISNKKKTDEKLRKIAWNQSHQVRGPLTDILGILNILKMDISEEEKITLMEQLETAAKQLDQVIHKVIDETRKPI